MLDIIPTEEDNVRHHSHITTVEDNDGIRRRVI